jgi:hypothetical protein
MTIIQVDNEQKTIHFSHQHTIWNLPPLPLAHKKKKEPLSFHGTPSH